MNPVRILGARAGQILQQIVPEIGERYRKGQHVILLVPEQYTLQAERELVERLDLPGMLELEVLSPRRLNRQIRERAGASRLKPLDDRGRSMAISQAINQVRDQLTYYARVADQPGLPDKIASLMGDMQKAGMTPEELHEHAESLKSGAARAKQNDIALIWAAYEELLSGRFADETMQQQDMIQRVRRSGVMDGTAVYVYGFDVLQQPMCELLAESAAVADQITVTLTMDAKDAADGRIFLTQRQSASELVRRLKEHEVPWEMRYLPPAPEWREPALSHVERWLFTRMEAPFVGDASAVSVHAAANPYAEAAYAAQKLRRWHEDGMPWGHMAVALAETGSLPGILAVTLRAAGIPHYLAQKDSAIRHGLCRMLIGSVRAACNGYGTRDVLLAAKSGFSPLTDEEAMRLENYVLENGIDHGKWIRSFTRGDAAEQMESLRERLITPMQALHDALRGAKTAAQSVEAVFHMLEEVSAYEHLMQRENELLIRGMQAEAAQNRQVWQIVMGLLDQMYALLGEKRAAMKDLARMVEAGLTSASISSLPPEPDTVMVGEAGHLMTGRVEALILMGMQDGVTASGMDSLITEQERAELTEAVHRPIGLTRQEQSALRQADFYRTVALPEKRLVLTFSESSQDGAAMRPAGMINDLRLLFPHMTVSGGVTADGRGDAPLSPLTALDGLALRLRAMADGKAEELDAAWQEALRWLWQDADWHERTRVMVESLNAKVEAGMLTRDETRSLFTQDTVSISRLEGFAACPYRHFIDYGLKPVERRAFTFAPDEKGSFFHAALQQYATLASAEPSWPDLPDEEIDRMVDQVVQPLTKEWEGGPLREDAVGRQLGEAYIRSVRRSAWMFTKHARNSRFTTVGAEVRFGDVGGLPPVILTLGDGRRVALRGVIDRIDRYEGDRGLYLRVIDYKSSERQLDPVRMWYGLQLQLLLYLKAAEQMEEGAKPAGAFYFHVNSPTVKTARDIREEAEKQIAHEMRLKGVVLADVEVIEAMDADVPEYSIGKVFNKNGTLGANANAYDLDEMHALLDHAQRTAAELTDRIRGGCIDIAPAKIKAWSACDYCAYAGVCGRDPALPGGEPRELEFSDKKELMARMANGNSEENFPQA